jgi:hypothetical protein
LATPHPWRGGRAVECGGLENRCASSRRTEGSNPSPSVLTRGRELTASDPTGKHRLERESLIRSRIWQALLIAFLGVLAAATVFHILLATDVIAFATDGRQPSGYGLVRLAAVSLTVAGLIFLFCSIPDEPRPGGVVSSMREGKLLPLVAPAAAALVVSRFYSPNSYYLPERRAIAEGATSGVSNGVWAVVILAALAVALGYRWRRAGLLILTLVCWLSAVMITTLGYGN